MTQSFCKVGCIFFAILVMGQLGCTEDNKSAMEPAEDMGIAQPNIPLPPSNDDFFQIDTILEVDIEMQETDWNSLRFQTQTLDQVLGGDCLDGPRANPFSYFNANVTVNGTTLTDVGIRKEGFLGNLSYDKPSLELKFDHNSADLRLGEGLRQMHLRNVQQDRSKLNTCLIYELFRNAGLVAPRCNFAHVKINSRDYGVFVHVEAIDDDFVALNTAPRAGALFRGQYSDFRPIWQGSFAPLNDLADESEIIGEVTAALALEADNYLDELSRHIDVDKFLTFWAMEAIVGQVDSYSGFRNNFILLQPTDGLAVMVPGNVDTAFNTIDNPFTEGPDPQSIMAGGMIANKLYQDPMMRAAYEARLRELLDTVWDEEALLPQTEAMATVIDPHLLADFRTVYLLDQDRVRGFIQTRKQTLLDAISSGLEEWNLPLPEPNFCWRELGEIDVTFSTEWDSLYTPNPLESGVGEVTFETYRFGDNNVLNVREAAIAGIDRDNMSIPEEQYPVRMSIISLLVDNRVDIINLYLPAPVYPFALNDGVNLRLDQTYIDGYRFTLSPPNYDMGDNFARLGDGTFSVIEASQMPGEPIRARLQGKWFSLGGYTSGSGQ